MMVGRVQQNILEFEVAMHDAVRVRVLDRHAHLTEEAAREIGPHATANLQKVEEITRVGVLCHDAARVVLQQEVLAQTGDVLVCAQPAQHRALVQTLERSRRAQRRGAAAGATVAVAQRGAAAVLAAAVLGAARLDQLHCQLLLAKRRERQVDGGVRTRAHLHQQAIRVQGADHKRLATRWRAVKLGHRRICASVLAGDATCAVALLLDLGIGRGRLIRCRAGRPFTCGLVLATSAAGRVAIARRLATGPRLCRTAGAVGQRQVWMMWFSRRCRRIIAGQVGRGWS
mmetsp:Transcript_37473/g.94146  ORF Transcript_37473/g.94146 Transcript_37473/m.94146 type:complete len:286 (+) Transcript_37473:1508-2365(+)